MDDSLDQKLTSAVLQFKGRLDAAASFDRRTDYGPKSYKPDMPKADPKQPAIIFDDDPSVVEPKRLDGVEFNGFESSLENPVEDDSWKPSEGAFFPSALPEYVRPEEPVPAVIQGPLTVIIAGSTSNPPYVDSNGTFLCLFQPQFLPDRVFMFDNGVLSVAAQYLPPIPGDPMWRVYSVDDAAGAILFNGYGGPGSFPSTNAGPGGTNYGGTALVQGSPY